MWHWSISKLPCKWTLPTTSIGTSEQRPTSLTKSMTWPSGRKKKKRPTSLTKSMTWPSGRTKDIKTKIWKKLKKNIIDKNTTCKPYTGSKTKSAKKRINWKITTTQGPGQSNRDQAGLCASNGQARQNILLAGFYLFIYLFSDLLTKAHSFGRKYFGRKYFGRKSSPRRASSRRRKGTMSKCSRLKGLVTLFPRISKTSTLRTPCDGKVVQFRFSLV